LFPLIVEIKKSMKFIRDTEDTIALVEASPLKRTLGLLLTTIGSGVRNEKVSQAVASMLGLAGPVAIGVMAGQVKAGVAASLGGLALGSEGKGVTFRERLRGLLYASAAGTLAMLVGAGVSGHGSVTNLVMVAIAAVAAFFGSISYSMARATTLFMLFAIIAANIGIRTTHPLAVTVLFFMGAAWTAGLSLVLKPLFRSMGIGRASLSAPARPAMRYTAKQYLRRWRKSLAHLSGWHYTIRITLCLLASVGVDWLWPHHHGYWVLITVVILVRRDLGSSRKLMFQRAIGTVIGVLATSLLLLRMSSIWAAVVMMAILAGIRPVLMETNYTAYTAVQTPLVILLLDFGQPSWGGIVDRLTATLAGCAIALLLGYIGWGRLLTSSPRINSTPKKIVS
jgi:uncharacterized membrane protein YccC